MSEDEIEGFVEDVIEEVIEETVHNPELQDALDALEELDQQLEKVDIDSIKQKADSLNIKIKVEVETNE
jgi:hypothetical protein